MINGEGLPSPDRLVSYRLVSFLSQSSKTKEWEGNESCIQRSSMLKNDQNFDRILL